MGMVGRTTTVPRAPLRTRPRDPPPTGDPQPPQPPGGRPLQRSKDIRTHSPQFRLAGPPTNGERLCGILRHVCMRKISETQTLWKVETTSDTLPTMVIYLDGLHRTTSSLRELLHHPSSHQPFNEAGNIHTFPRHRECSASSAAIPHPRIFQTRGPITCHIGPRFGVHITFFPLLGETTPNEVTLHIGLPPGRGRTDGAC